MKCLLVVGNNAFSISDLQAPRHHGLRGTDLDKKQGRRTPPRQISQGGRTAQSCFAIGIVALSRAYFSAYRDHSISLSYYRISRPEKRECPHLPSRAVVITRSPIFLHCAGESGQRQEAFTCMHQRSAMGVWVNGTKDGLCRRLWRIGLTD